MKHPKNYFMKNGGFLEMPFIENSMNGSTIKTIVIKRAKALIGLMNLTYNLFRKVQVANPIG